MNRQKNKNFRKGRVRNLPVIFVLTFLMFVMTFGMAFADDPGIDYSDKPNLKAAIDHYLGTADYSQFDLVFLDSGAPYIDIEDCLKELNKQNNYSGPEKPTIVYAPSGTYHITGTTNLGKGDVAGIKIPNNVIFVAEDKSIFIDEKKSDGHPLVMVCGSLYGGRYQSAKYVIKYMNNKNFNENNADAPSGEKLPNGTAVRKINGNVEYTEVEGPGKSGIQAIGAKGINILHNYVGGGKAKNTTGIDLMYGAHARNISYNTVKDIGSSDYGSAISVTHSDAINIVGNNISNIAGHGISTDSEQRDSSKKLKPHAYCRIDYITKNTINGAKHGIWLEDACQVTKGIIGNTIKNTRHNGIAVSGTRAYAKGCNWSIFSMKDNKILSSKRSNISITGKYAKVCMRGNNLIDTSKQTNVITIDKAGRLDIKGDKNTIKRGKGNGIYLMNRSVLNITGKNNTITANKGFGVNVTSKSKAVVKNTNAKGNKKYSFRVCKGSSLKISKCKKDKVLKTTSTK